MATYCTKEELGRYGINREALEKTSETDQDKAIGAASGIIDSYLRSRFTLPLVAFGEDIRMHCAAIAVYILLRTRGYNPAEPDDDMVQTGYDQAIAWLKDVAANRATPDVTDSSPGSPAPGARGGAPRVESNSQRGWFRRDGKGGAFSGGR